MVSIVMVVAIESYFLKVIIFLEYDIMKHKIMFEDRKVREKEQQIKFSGHKFARLYTWSKQSSIKKRKCQQEDN